MIIQTLSCGTFGLPAAAAPDYVSLARQWAGQTDLEASEDGSVQWVRQTRVHLGGSHWLREAQEWDVGAQSALLRIGELQSGTVSIVALAFLSPFSAAAAAFRQNVPRLARTQFKASSLFFAIDDFANAQAREPNGVLRAVEGRTQAGDRVSLEDRDRLQWPPPRLNDKLYIHSVSVEIFGHIVKIDRRFHIELPDMSTTVAEAATVLRAVFHTARPNLSVRPPRPQQAL